MFILTVDTAPDSLLQLYREYPTSSELRTGKKKYSLQRLFTGVSCGLALLWEDCPEAAVSFLCFQPPSQFEI